MVNDVAAPVCTEEGLPEPAPMTVDRVAEIGKALAHPARVKIVQLFQICRPYKVQEIVETCELAQSTISEHLRILRRADVVFARRDGPRTWYCLRRSVLREYVNAIDQLRSTDEFVQVADLQRAAALTAGTTSPR